VVAAIFLPLGFLTGLFGVNVAGMPGTEATIAFWLLTGASVVSGIALFVVFKYSKWL
jgi:zinc transporter